MYNENNTELLSVNNPCERIIIQDEDIKSNDLTLPIKWIFDEE